LPETKPASTSVVIAPATTVLNSVKFL